MSKDLGPWEGSPISTLKQAFGNEVCGNGLQWAINKINTASGPSGQPNLIDYYNLPELECIPAFGPGVGSGVGGYDLECLYETGADFDFGEGTDAYGDPEDGDIFDYLNEIEECAGNNGYNRWYNHLSGAVIVDLSDSTRQPVDIISKELFDPNGEFNSPSITLDEGLYSIATISNKGQYISNIMEVKNEFTSTIELASLFTAKIFPNPIPEDRFKLEMNADANLKYDFVLTDMRGTTLLRRNFVLQKGKSHTVNIKMKGNNNLPTGTLVGTFVFKDGSTKSYNIIKN